MDHTSNDLLNVLSNITKQSMNSNNPAVHPTGPTIDDAFIENLIQTASQIEPAEAESLLAGFGDDFSPHELIAAAEALLGEDVLPDSIHEAIPGTNESPDPNSSFAKDPYVAESGDEASTVTAVPKSVEEILDSISGYQIETQLGQDPGIENGLSTGPDVIDQEQQEISYEMLTESIEQIESDVATESGQSENQAKETTDLHSVKGEESQESIDEGAQPEFHIDAFSDALEIIEGTPDPIRGGYEVDRETFDYEVVEEPDVYADAIEHFHGSAPPTVEQSATVASPSTESPTVQTTNNPESENLPDDNYFWANTGDVITIDGSQGFGHIDLACFDVSEASFRGNQIQIACEDGTSFLIEHRNVTHAIFADGVEIELTSDGTDAEPA